MRYLYAECRHHTCEVCHEQFNCHLCTTHEDHQLHRPAYRDYAEYSDRAYFVCLDCILSDPERQLTVRYTQNRHRLRVYNHITGELVNPNILARKVKRRYGEIRISGVSK